MPNPFPSFLLSFQVPPIVYKYYLGLGLFFLAHQVYFWFAHLVEKKNQESFHIMKSQTQRNHQTQKSFHIMRSQIQRDHQIQKSFYTMKSQIQMC